jgi:hypothetical protein
MDIMVASSRSLNHNAIHVKLTYNNIHANSTPGCGWELSHTVELARLGAADRVGPGIDTDGHSAIAQAPFNTMPSQPASLRLGRN